MPGELFFTLSPDEPLYSPILVWGLAVVRAVQGARIPGLTALMSFVSGLSVGLVVLLPVILFWCINEKKGARLGTLLIVSGWINSFLKALLKQPRPFNLDASVGLASESTFGLPSGHAQMSLVLLVVLAYWYGNTLRNASRSNRQKKIVWIAAVSFILLVAFSRIYLGVHFPTDIAGGWLVGGVLLTLFFLFFSGEKRAARLLEAAGKRGRLITAAAAALLMQMVYPEDSSLAALLLGFAGGYALLIDAAPFSPKKPIGGKTPGLPVFGLRCLVGAAGAALVYVGLRTVFPGGSFFKNVSWWGPNSPYLELGRFIRYGVLGLWFSAGAPLLFGKLNLAEVKPGSGGGD